MAATKKSTTKRPTSVSAWKNKKTEPVELPSGHFAKIRPASMEFFLSAGFIPNALRGIVQKAIAQVDDKGGSPKMDEGLAAILADEEKLADLMRMYDKIAAHCFEEPKVVLPPEDEDEREDDVLYTDELDFEDKVFVFNLSVGGTKDLESFRRQQDQSVELIHTSEKVDGTTE